MRVAYVAYEVGRGSMRTCLAYVAYEVSAYVYMAYELAYVAYEATAHATSSAKVATTPSSSCVFFADMLSIRSG